MNLILTKDSPSLDIRGVIKIYENIRNSQYFIRNLKNMFILMKAYEEYIKFHEKSLRESGSSP